METPIFDQWLHHVDHLKSMASSSWISSSCIYARHQQAVTLSDENLQGWCFRLTLFFHLSRSACFPPMLSTKKANNPPIVLPCVALIWTIKDSTKQYQTDWNGWEGFGPVSPGHGFRINEAMVLWAIACWHLMRVKRRWSQKREQPLNRLTRSVLGGWNYSFSHNHGSGKRLYLKGIQ